MGVICTTMLVRKRQGFAARKDFIPTVTQQGWVLQAQQAQHTGAGTAKCQTPSPVPRAALAPAGVTQVQPGELESSVSSNRLISALIFNWENDGPLTRHCSISHQGLRDATEEMIFLPYVSAFNLNLSVTLAHLGINVTSRLLWCTQDACGLFHIPVRGWQECPHSRNPSEPKLQQPLPRHPPASAHTGQQKACRLSRELCELKSSWFWKLPLWHCFLKMQLPNERNARVTRTAPGHGTLLPPLGTDTAGCAGGQEHTR